MRTYLVTGGAGFIGSNYIHYMFKKYDNEIRIINVDKLTYAGNLENLKDVENRDNYTFVKADICDKEAIRKVFEENDIDRVVHFAAESHVDRSIKNPEVFVQTNVLGTAVMLNCAKEAWQLEDGTFKEGKKFLHVSTDEVYGSLPDDDNAFFYETTPYDPHSPYSASKASSDMLVKAYMDTYKFPANITNCSNNYGPYQFPEKLIPLIINNALHGKDLPVYGDGKNVRDWLYVEDHAKGIDMVQEQGKLFETYNIGGHNEKQNIQIIHIILDTLQEMLPDSDPRKALVSENLIKYVTDRAGHDRRYAIAPDKIKYPSIDDDRASRNSTKHRGIPREVLFENVPVEKLVYSVEELTSKYYSIIKDVPIDKQLIIAQAMHSGNEDSIRSLLEKEMNIVHIYSQEDAHTEYKSSLFKHPDPRKGDKEQMRELLQEIVAFANAHIEGHLFIGLNNNGSPTGLEKELCSDACPFETREKLQSDFCNRLQQATNSKLLMNSLKFNWSQTEDHHLYLRIDVPVWNGDIVLLYGNELYLRKETGVFMLEDSDMIAYIRQTA